MNVKEGVVKWFDRRKGYGFITGEDGKEYFVHFQHISSSFEFKALMEGEKVIFQVEETKKGLMAVDVEPQEKYDHKDAGEIDGPVLEKGNSVVYPDGKKYVIIGVNSDSTYDLQDISDSSKYLYNVKEDEIFNYIINF